MVEIVEVAKLHSSPQSFLWAQCWKGQFEFGAKVHFLLAEEELFSRDSASDYIFTERRLGIFHTRFLPDLVLIWDIQDSLEGFRFYFARCLVQCREPAGAVPGS